jgi:ribosomal protein S18 acetylase RimI-like enzyme
MELGIIHSKKDIERFLREQEVNNFIYRCNNLEPPFWEKTQWYGLYDEGKLVSIAMFVTKYDIPVLIACNYKEDGKYQEELLLKLRPHLPCNIYCHIDEDSAKYMDKLAKNKKIKKYNNMLLDDPSVVPESESSRVKNLGMSDVGEINKFLQIAHPDHFLDVEFVEEGYFYGLYDNGKLVSLAGITAKSKKFGIVAIGNIATDPEYRGKGLATEVVTVLINRLSKEFKNISLNVKCDNVPAVNFYKKLGFRIIGTFDEVIFN